MVSQVQVPAQQGKEPACIEGGVGGWGAATVQCNWEGPSKQGTCGFSLADSLPERSLSFSSWAPLSQGTRAPSSGLPRLLHGGFRLIFYS